MNDFEALADFRYHIRRFLHFSEEAARLSGIEPQHHQLLLAARGFRGEPGEGPTIRYLADRLQIRHHSAVELVDRMVSHGLVERLQNERDRRQVIVSLTRAGDRILRKLSADHLRELREMGPALVVALESIVGVPRCMKNELGDFTCDRRVIPISGLAIVIGIISTYIAYGLLKLIGFFTNLFYFGRFSTALVSPAGNHLGLWAVLVPVAGAMVIGLMARYGSERIRGHGIPEAIESILINGSRVQPRLAILKPLSSAISIGSGGPFGAEGPIIMTGGAFGSMIAQFFHLTNHERKTLLVAGAAAGMSATFASPVAAILLAVELLLFEWKPRSAIPVALASVAAGAVRRYVIGLGPLFPVPPHPIFIGPEGLLGCAVAGLLAGMLSGLLTLGVYAAEDAFQKLPIHWMWWPAIGGVVVGVGGLIFPQALGVGYDTIGALLQGDVPRYMIAGILLVKSTIWVVSLGSGTSGGVLAPLLMMGGALGGLEAMFLPHEGIGFWPVVSMAAILGGTMRSPFTGIIFALELTHDINLLLPLTVAAFLAHAFTTLTLKRSILTEKVARRGYHLSREYAVDPLEILFVREVMRTSIVALPANEPVALKEGHTQRGQMLYPVVTATGRLEGVVTRKNQLHRDPVICYPDEPLRVVVYRMAETGRTRLPVISDAESRKLVGIVSLDDLLKARVRSLDEERRRERVLRIRLPSGAPARQASD